ncbi:hypothetical protein MP638_000555 [Amoeboaphelidium occidentale]|nr:hypothetical protein MP638_000555 [Amoeboaphelidium occidentale]
MASSTHVNLERIYNVVYASNLQELTETVLSYQDKMHLLMLYYCAKTLKQKKPNDLDSTIEDVAMVLPPLILAYILEQDDVSVLVSVDNLSDCMNQQTPPAACNSRITRSKTVLYTTLTEPVTNKRRKSEIMAVKKQHESILLELQSFFSRALHDNGQISVLGSCFVITGATKENLDLVAAADVLKQKLNVSATLSLIDSSECKWDPSFDGWCLINDVLGSREPGHGLKFNLEFSRYLLPYTDALVEYLNQFIFVVDIPTCYGWRSYDEGQYQFDTLSILKERFSNVAISKWMFSDSRRSFMKTDFIVQNEKQESTTYNTYNRPEMIDYGSGSIWDICPNIHKFLLNIVANKDPNCFQFIVTWMAKMWQHGQTRIALVLLGGQGIGKTTFAELAGTIAGEEYCVPIDMKDLKNQFNNCLHEKVLIIVNEVVAGAHKDESLQNRLKTLITDPTLKVELKGVDSFKARNNCNFIICSNNNSPVDIPEDNRRFVVLKLNEEKKQNQEYFQKLREEIKNQYVIKALRHHLYYNVKVLECLTPFRTEMEKELVNLNASSTDVFVSEVFELSKSSEMFKTIMVGICEVHHGSAARNAVLSAGVSGPYVDQWLQEHQVTLLRLKNHKSYALLAKIDIDPLRTHNDPYVLHYIYTDPSERGHGYASSLLKHLKQSYEVTFFPEDPDRQLFRRAGFVPMHDDSWEKSVYQYGSPNNNGFSAVTAYLSSTRRQYYYSARDSGAAKWSREALLFKRRCRTQARQDDVPFQLQEFNSIVSHYPELRIVVFSSITKKVLQLPDRNPAVFTGEEWVKPDIELKPDTTDDEKTAWVLQDGNCYYWIRVIGGYMRHCHGDSGQKFCPLCFSSVATNVERQRFSVLMNWSTTVNSQFTEEVIVRNVESRWPLGNVLSDMKYGVNQKGCNMAGARNAILGTTQGLNIVVDGNFVQPLTRDSAYLESEDENETCEEEEDVGDPSTAGHSSPRAYHYAYDIECRLNTVVDEQGEEVPGKQNHSVCLIMVTALNNDNDEVVTFYELSQFFEWVFRKERGMCTFWAHNAKGYDNRFLYNYLCVELNITPKCMWQGNKLLQIAVGSRTFNDSLCHIARPLRQLPKMLGLTGDYKKGFFPHKFNTELSKDYLGPLPPMETFEPEKMKSDDSAEFTEWYEQERVRVGGTWKLQTEMEEYCKSDVLLLKEGLKTYDSLMFDLNEGISPLSCVTSAQYAMRVYRNLHMPLNTICQLRDDEYRFAKEAFSGGRTDVRCLQRTWSEEEVKSGEHGVYIDIQSMYPAVQYYDDMPCGKPRWLTFSDDDQPTVNYFETFMGIAECDIEPTKFMFHPIIGNNDKESGKYLFTLRPQKKSIITSIELQEAVKNGYKVTKVYRILEFDRSKDSFKDYVRKFLKIKIEASGFTGTDEEWVVFQQSHKEKLGIELRREDMRKNKGKREMAKLLLNFLWGKFGQRPDLQEEKFYSNEEYKKLLEAELDGKVSIDSQVPIPGNKMLVRTTRKNFADNLKNKNVAIAAFVAAGGRLRLWKTLNELDDRVLYHDTDSILYEYSATKSNVETGILLGEWADEYPGDKIVDFCGLGPKTYAFKTIQNKAAMKCKGFTLTAENEKILTLEACKDVLAGFLDGKPESIQVFHTHFGFQKFDTNAAMYSQDMNKKLKVTVEKGIVDRKTLKTFPFGYDQFGVKINELQ